MTIDIKKASKEECQQTTQEVFTNPTAEMLKAEYAILFEVAETELDYLTSTKEHTLTAVDRDTKEEVTITISDEHLDLYRLGYKHAFDVFKLFGLSKEELEDSSEETEEEDEIESEIIISGAIISGAIIA